MSHSVFLSYHTRVVTFITFLSFGHTIPILYVEAIFMNTMNMAALIVGIAAVVTLGYYLIPVFSPSLAERLKIAETEKASSDSETER